MRRAGREGRGGLGRDDPARRPPTCYKFHAECTPGYYNNEGMPRQRSESYGDGPVVFHALLRDWRANGGMHDVLVDVGEDTTYGTAPAFGTGTDSADGSGNAGAGADPGPGGRSDEDTSCQPLRRDRLHRHRSPLDIRRLNAPNPLWGSNGVAFGPDGRLYVAQFLAGRISAVDPASGDIEIGGADGRPGPVAGRPRLRRGRLDVHRRPGARTGVAPQPAGRVHAWSPTQVKVPNGITCVGDRLFVNEMRMNGRLLELFPDGGEPRVLAEGLALGNAMQRGPDGHLYYPHMLTGQVWRVSPDGGAPELVAEDVHEPVAVRFDLGGVMLVLSRGRDGIVTRIDLHGTGSRSLVTSGVAGLDNAAFDAENRMFVSSYADGGITELHPDGRTRDLVPRGLDGPYGVTVDLARHGVRGRPLPPGGPEESSGRRAGAARTPRSKHTGDG